MSPAEMGNAVEKIRSTGNENVMLTERGTFFGYNRLVNDFTGLAVMREFGVPVVFDVTHSTQQPAGLGTASGGNPQYSPLLARAAVAAGVDGLFLECHPNPRQAKSDAATMLGLGFSSGLPFALLVGTLNAWLGEVGINLATIGVLSWIGLSYSFKFLWSPLVDRLPLPGLDRLGRRKSWILLCQTVIVLAFAGLAATSPAQAIGTFALFAFLAALASATQDIAIDAWRIDQADEDNPIELLSALTQFGYRTASIVGGAVALVLAGTTMTVA